MWWLILITIVQTFLWVELGLLFIKVMGSTHRLHRLGRSSHLLQGGYLWLCKGLGGLFLGLAGLNLIMGILQVAAIWP